MKVLCINPPVYTFGYYHNACHYPPGLYHVATYYKNQGHDVEVLDMMPELVYNSHVKTKEDGHLYYDDYRVVLDTKTTSKCGDYENQKMVRGLLRVGLPDLVLIDKLTNCKYDLILVQCTFTYLWRGAHEAIDICKRIQPEAQVHFGGVYPTLCPDHARTSKADKIITGRFFENPFITVDTSLFPYKPFRIAVTTALGCKNRCRYCAVSNLEGGSRVERPVKDVIEDMRSKIDLGFNSFRFLDSNILDNWENHLKPILEFLRDYGKGKLRITTYGGVEANMLGEEQVRLMRQAGFIKMTIPLESADIEKLTEWNRPSGIEQFKKSVKIASNYYINEALRAYVLIGYPGQTYDVARKAVDLCIQNKVFPDLLAFTAIPGTKLEDKTKTLEELNPILWPYSSSKFTIRQIESLFSEIKRAYKDRSHEVGTKETGDITKNLYTTGPAILPGSAEYKRLQEQSIKTAEFKSS